jgi:hypothetical protein
MMSSFLLGTSRARRSGALAVPLLSVLGALGCELFDEQFPELFPTPIPAEHCPGAVECSSEPVADEPQRPEEEPAPAGDATEPGSEQPTETDEAGAASGLDAGSERDAGSESDAPTGADAASPVDAGGRGRPGDGPPPPAPPGSPNEPPPPRR